jgi:hypothetical protein
MLRFFKGSEKAAVVDVEYLIANRLFQSEEEYLNRMLKSKRTCSVIADPIGLQMSIDSRGRAVNKDNGDVYQKIAENGDYGVQNQ